MKFLLRKNHDKNFSNMIYRKLARKIFMNMLNIGSNQVLQDGLIKIILKFSNILSEMQKGCLNFCATNHQLLIYGAECIDFIVNNPWVVLSPKLWSTVKYFLVHWGNVCYARIMTSLMGVYTPSFFSGTEFTFSFSRFGKPLIKVGDYRYNLHTRTQSTRRQWLCNKRRTVGCKASLITIEDQIVLFKYTHNH